MGSFAAGGGGAASAVAVDSVKPGDAEGARFDADNDTIAIAEAVEIVRVHGEAFVAAAFAPGVNEEAARAPHHTFHLVAAQDGGVVVAHILWRIEPAIEKERHGKNKGNRNQAGEEMLEDFDVLAGAGTPFQKNNERKRGEKNDTEEAKPEPSPQPKSG